MRRRIDTHESISDCTTRPHHYLNEYDGTLQFEDSPPALYDEALWDELRQAQQRLRDVELRVIAALVTEPLDAIEIECGRKLWRMIGGRAAHDHAEWSRIEDALREHAKTVERKP